MKGQHDLDDQQRAALKSRLADVHASFEQPEQSIVLRHTCRMEQPSVDTPRVATVPEAATVARLLDTFNRDYDTPTPGTAVLATRLGRLLAGGDVIALLTGDPAVAVALLTLRPNIWYEGPVALLDELYVAPELRERGLGSALLTTAEAVTRQRGGELLARRFVAGNPLGDTRGAQGRSRELRDLMRADPAAVAAEQARLLRLGLQLPLFDL